MLQLKEMRSYWVHGWATDIAVFGRLIGNLPPGLKEKAVAVDLPGFRSAAEGSVSNEYSSHLAARILAEKGKAESVALVGWSLGAMAALSAAAELGEAVSGLVLISGCARFSRSEDNPHGMDRRVIKRMVRKLKKAPDEVIKDFHHRMFSDSTPGRLESFRDSFYPQYLNLDAGALERGLHYLESADLRGCLTGLRCPVLVVHARADRIIDIRLAGLLNDSLEKSRLVVLEDSDHIPFWGAEKRFASLIGAFLLGQTGSRELSSTGNS